MSASGTTTAAIDTAGRVAMSLPAQFLALCLVNVIFISTLFWYEARQSQARMELVEKVMDACVPLLHARP